MKNIELCIIAFIAVFAFVGCCHTHHRKVVVIKNPYPRPQKHEAVLIEKYYYEDRWFRSKSKKRR